MSRRGRVVQRLESAVDDLYVAFASYRLKERFEDRCSPVGNRREIARLLSVGPLRSLPVEVLAIYAFKALLTMGDEEDFKHFLPRMLELYAFAPEWHQHPTRVFGNIGDLQWQRWPRLEVSALEHYFQALWLEVRCSFQGPVHAGALLSDLATAGLRVRDFLMTWDPAESLQSTLRAAELIEWIASADASTLQGTLPDIESWSNMRAVESTLVEAFVGSSRQPFAAQLAFAADQLRSMFPCPR